MNKPLIRAATPAAQLVEERADVRRALCAAALVTRWRLCPFCGELAVPPGRTASDCFACAEFVPTPDPNGEPTDDR